MRLRTGTGISRGWDVRKIAQAIAGPDVDTRFWLSMGIVATVDEDGNVDDANPNAVLVSAEGVEVDVVLLPSLDPVTCRLPSGGPRATDDSPIFPGDEVLVAIPDGLPGTPPVVVGVLNSAADPLPVDSGDSRPLFRNDRRLIWCDGIPIDLRTNGARVLINPDGTVVLTGDVFLGGPDAAEQVIWGTSFMGALDALLTDSVPSLLTAFTALAAVSVGPFAAFQPGFSQAVTALQNFKLQAEAAANWLSSTTRTK